jgi:hypothetical protein
MSILQEISKRLLAVANLPPEQRNNALTEVLIYIEEVQYDMVLEQKQLIMSVIEDLIAENDADQIAKSKLVFVPEVEEQIAPTKKTRAKKVKPVAKVELEDLPDFIDNYPTAEDLPEPVRKLAGLRRKEQGITKVIKMTDQLSSMFDWEKTGDGGDFWNDINTKGDLREFKSIFGNKGEKVDELIEFAELSEFVENEFLPNAQTVTGDLPDTIDEFISVKDLPDPIKRLAVFRSIEQNKSINFNDILARAFTWDETPEGDDFWSDINSKGNLREFKRIYGNKGESVDGVIDGLVGFNELLELANKQNAPAVKKQKLIFLSLIFYPPVGSSIQLDLYNPVELHSIVLDILDKLNVNDLIFSFDAVTDFSSYITKVKLYGNNSTNEMVDTLMEQFDTFVTPELDWSDFYNNGTDILRIKENRKLVSDAFKPKAKPVVTPAPAPVITPKVVAPKPVKVEKPKPVPVEKPKSVKVATPKPIKQTKPKVEDDLSFLNDLDNIF